MTLYEVQALLHATIFYGPPELMQQQVQNACGSDLMSDVLAYVKDQSLLLTGLVNPQVIRTAQMMDFLCVVFVRGKQPDEEMLRLARQCSIVLLGTEHRMFTACGTLFQSGLEGGSR